jgi:hypothetical protein
MTHARVKTLQDGDGLGSHDGFVAIGTGKGVDGVHGFPKRGDHDFMLAFLFRFTRGLRVAVSPREILRVVPNLRRGSLFAEGSLGNSRVKTSAET